MQISKPLAGVGPRKRAKALKISTAEAVLPMSAVDAQDDAFTQNDRRALQRKQIELKAVQVERAVSTALGDYSQRSGKPKRWIVEEAIRAALGIKESPYVVRDNDYLAGITIQWIEAQSSYVPLQAAVRQLQHFALERGMVPPHPQTARAAMRKRLGPESCVFRKWERRPPREFTCQDDTIIERLRTSGKSLATIAERFDRRPHVIRRRLIAKAERQELSIDNGKPAWDE